MTPRSSSTVETSRIPEPPGWIDRALPTLVAVVVFSLPTLSVAYTETSFGRALTGSAVGTALLLTPLAMARVRRVATMAHQAPLLALGVMTLSMTVSVAVHPSQQGMTLTAAAWIGSALAVAIASFDRRTIASHMVTPLLSAAALQGVLMTVPWFTKEPVGLRWLAPSRSLQEIDGFLRPQGTATHVYEPTVLALLAIGVAAALADDGRHHRLWPAAAEVMATSPQVGVGPGRYLDVAADLGIADPEFPIATHGFILLAGAELGLPAAAAIAVLLGWTYVTAWRTNRVVFAAAMGVLPFLVVDKLLYDRIFGIVLLSIWLGTTAALLGRPDPDVAT